MLSTTKEELKETLTAIKRIRGIAVATIEDERPLDEGMHRERFREYTSMWQIVTDMVNKLKQSGVQIDHPNPFRDLKELYGYLKGKSRNWAGRRQIIEDFYDPLEQKINDLLAKDQFGKEDSTVMRKEDMLNKKKNGMKWNAFICHASEDKATVVEPLVKRLTDCALKIWYDQYVLRIGDSLRRKIDEGLTQSRFGIVILSPDFFKKEWPQWELDGLVQREVAGQKVILPVWHNVNREVVARYSPSLTDKVAGITDDTEKLVKGLIEVIKPKLNAEKDWDW
jgi:hypothetical protein